MLQEVTSLEVLTSLGNDSQLDVGFQEAYDAIIRGGDCALDSFQGVYWASQNRHLLEHPTTLEVRLECPVIACGSGPSLDRAADKLRELNGLVPIFCAESSAKSLLEYGITPDYVCPLERVSCGIDFFDGLRNRTTYAGSYVSQHANGFQKYVVAANNAWINEWMGYGETCSSARSSGGLAALVAATISNREVFLVGLDGCASDDAHHCSAHWDGKDQVYDCDVMCYDGKMRPSIDLWRQTAYDVGYSLQKRGGVFQTDAATAVMPFVGAASLPSKDDVKNVDTSLKVLSQHSRTLDGFNSYAKSFRDDFEKAYNRARTWSSPDEFDTSSFYDTKNGPAIAYIMSTVIRQMTIEKALGRGEYVCEWFCDAMGNILDNLWNLMGEIQDG